MLLFAPHSAEKFTAAPISGLRSLLAVPDAAAGTRAGAGCVVTRAAIAAHGCGCGHREDVKERRDDDRTTSPGHGEGVAGTATEEAEEEEEKNDYDMDVKGREEEDELDGFWVSYGRRCPRRRRLPPPIPSLVARGALRRTRTDDGRLVIRIVPVVRPECIRARRRRDRLAVVEHEDDSPVVALPPPPLCEPPTTAAREDGGVRIDNVAQVDDDADTLDAGERGHHVEDAVAAAPAETTLPAPVPPPRVPSVGCFEEVFKLDSIGSSSLHQMPSLRMVH